MTAINFPADPTPYISTPFTANGREWLWDVATQSWRACTQTLNKERRHEWTGTYDYCGYAVAGSSESAAVWTITRLTIATDGTVTTGRTVGVKWSDRATATYV